MEDEIVKGLPTGLKWVGGALGAIITAALFLRQYLSSAKVDRTANEANVATITRLQDELQHERERADSLMREREAMAKEIGELRGEVKGLREQIERLRDMITAQRGLPA